MYELNTIQRSGSPVAPRICIYGPGGIGKTRFPLTMPHPVYMNLNDGLTNIDAATTPIITTFRDLIGWLRSPTLLESDRLTYVVDALGDVQQLIYSEVVADHDAESIADNKVLSFNKGYVYALDYWVQFKDALQVAHNAGKAIVLIAHVEKITKRPVGTDPHDYYDLNLHIDAAELIYQYVDICAYVQWNTLYAPPERAGGKGTALKSGGISMYVQDSATFRSKTRFQMPEVMDFNYPSLAKYIKFQHPKPKILTKSKEQKI